MCRNVPCLSTCDKHPPKAKPEQSASTTVSLSGSHCANAGFDAKMDFRQDRRQQHFPNRPERCLVCAQFLHHYDTALATLESDLTSTIARHAQVTFVPLLPSSFPLSAPFPSSPNRLTTRLTSPAASETKHRQLGCES